MGSFNLALLDALLSIGVLPERAHQLVELLDRSIEERYGLRAQVLATKRDVAELETRLTRDMAALDNRLVHGLAECNSRIAEAKVDLVKWLLGALTAQTALIAGIVKLL